MSGVEQCYVQRQTYFSDGEREEEDPRRADLPGKGCPVVPIPLLVPAGDPQVDLNVSRLNLEIDTAPPVPAEHFHPSHRVEIFLPDATRPPRLRPLLALLLLLRLLEEGRQRPLVVGRQQGVPRRLLPRLPNPRRRIEDHQDLLS